MSRLNKLLAPLALLAALAGWVLPPGRSQVVDTRFARPGVFFEATGSTTVAGTAVETSLISTGIGSATVNANTFYAGKTLKVFASGTIGNLLTPTLQLKIKLGSTVCLDSTAAVMTTITGTTQWFLEGYICCRSTGSSGTVFSQGYILYGTTLSAMVRVQMLNIGTTSLDTTVSQACDVTATWGTPSGSNTIASTNVIMEWMD